MPERRSGEAREREEEASPVGPDQIAVEIGGERDRRYLTEIGRVREAILAMSSSSAAAAASERRATKLGLEGGALR